MVSLLSSICPSLSSATSKRLAGERELPAKFDVHGFRARGFSTAKSCRVEISTLQLDLLVVDTTRRYFNRVPIWSAADFAR